MIHYRPSTGHQFFCLLLAAVGASLLTMSFSSAPYAELLNMQVTLADVPKSAASVRLHQMSILSWGLRAGGAFLTVLGVGGLLIPWMNSLVYRRTVPARIDSINDSVP